jgi:hypothetical protein
MIALDNRLGEIGNMAATSIKLCRTYGAQDFLCEFSQAFRPGLTYAAPTALDCLQLARRRRYEVVGKVMVVKSTCTARSGCTTDADREIGIPRRPSGGRLAVC